MHIQLILISEKRFASGDSLNHVAASLCRGVPATLLLARPAGPWQQHQPAAIIHNNE
jgi:hypothetical protein